MADITCTFKNLRGFWRGSTPKYKFKFSTVLSKFDDIKIGFSQNDALVFTKELADCKKEDDYSISITLTTEETMKFEEGAVTVQLEVTTAGGDVIPSIPYSLSCKDTVFSKTKEESDGDY